MQFSDLPLEIQGEIVKFCFPEQPEKFTDEEIKSYGRKFTVLSLVNSHFNRVCSKQSESAKTIFELVNKYNYYNDAAGGLPQLLDAVAAGCRLPSATSSVKNFTPEVEEDIKKIVTVLPQSLNSIIGRLRCRRDVPPLAMACFNENIPLHLIELLLKNGANPSVTYELDADDFGHVTILEDLPSNTTPERYAAIRELFLKYGATPPSRHT